MEDALDFHRPHPCVKQRRPEGVGGHHAGVKRVEVRVQPRDPLERRKIGLGSQNKVDATIFNQVKINWNNWLIAMAASCIEY